MLISRDTAQQIINNHGKAYDRNAAGLSVQCKDQTGKPFTVLQLNGGACSVVDFTGKLLVNLEKSKGGRPA